MKLLEQILHRNSINPEAVLSEAESLFLRNEDKAASRLLNSLEQQTLTPEQRWSMLLLQGWICHQHARHIQAMEYADRVLSESDDAYYLGRAHHLRGLSYRGKAYALPEDSETEVAAAKQEFELALDLLTGRQEQLSVFSSLAILLADTDQVDQAIALVESVLRGSLPPSEDLGWLHARLGELYVQDKGDCANGVKQLELALSLLEPTSIIHSWVHSLIAECYNKAGEFERACVHAKRALDLAKQDKGIQKFALIRAHEQYAISLAWGDFDLRLAERHLDIAIGIVDEESQKEDELNVRLGEVLNMQGRNAEALPLLEKVINRGGRVGVPHSLYALVGHVAVKSKEYLKAVEFLNLAVAESDGDVDLSIHSYLYLGIALYHLGRYDEASEAFRAGLRLAPANHPEWSGLMKWLLAANRLKA